MAETIHLSYMPVSQLKAVLKYPEETNIKVTVENVLVSPDAGLTTEFILSTKGKN